MTLDLYAALKKIFHEPNRLAIVSALLMEPEGMRFGEIKRECGLTDGNLSRHLKTLEAEGIVHIDKTFVNAKPMTRVFITEAGRGKFMDYLQALESVLKRASRAVKVNERAAGDVSGAPRRSPGTA